MRGYIEKILTKFTKIGLTPLLGAELEFYIIGSVSEELLKNMTYQIGLPIEKEKGVGQYEIASQVFSDPFLLIDFIERTREKLLTIAKNNNIKISFDPKPYKFDYGSGMHIHLSLIDKTNVNIFNHYDTIDGNLTILNSIGGILKLLNQSLHMIITEEENEFDRLHLSEMSPSTVSWGKNNRTTAVRIPDSHPYNRNRRIEFRVPSARSNIASSILFLLTSVIYGVEEKIQPGICIYGNAKDSHYSLIPLHKNVNDMKKDFHFWEIFQAICKEP